MKFELEEVEMDLVANVKHIRFDAPPFSSIIPKFIHKTIENMGRTTTSTHHHLLGLSLLPLLSNQKKQRNKRSGIHSIPASNKLHLCTD